MISIHSLRYLGRTAFFLVLITNMTLATAAAQGRRGGHKPGARAVSHPPLQAPLNSPSRSCSTPTPTPPCATRSQPATSPYLYAGVLAYGWFEVTRTGIHFSVVEPAKKSAEGFYLPTWQIKRAEIERKHTSSI